MTRAKKKNFASMREATGREQTVVLVSLITVDRAKVLEWLDKHSEEGQRGIPKTFEPRVDDDGAVFYRVPVPYARRLLEGEPYKYLLVEPSLIRVPMSTSAGGISQVMVSSKVKKKDEEGNTVKDKQGVPVWIDPEDALDDDELPGEE
jgi:hypothetical protein